MSPQADLMDKIVSLAKRRGFVYPGSEIYGGLANSWDYGPLGAQLKKNIKDLWWKMFVESREDVVGLESALIMNPKVWEATGHVATFSDPLVECLKCHSRYRTDQLIKNQSDFKKFLDGLKEDVLEVVNNWKSEQQSIEEVTGAFWHTLEKYDVKETYEDEEMRALGEKLNEKMSGEEKESLTKEFLPLLEDAKGKIALHKKKVQWAGEVASSLADSPKYLGLAVKLFLKKNSPCPTCGAHRWSIPRQFNLMLKTFLGPSEDSSALAYLRPETAQGMFVDFKNVLATNRVKPPFGIAQVGKAFRNEITPGNFIFRTREFEQMEIEYFIPAPKTDADWQEHFEHWKSEMESWLETIGADMTKVHAVEISESDRAFYSKRTIDFEFEYPFGQKELYGLAYRTDYDLSRHQEHSGENMKFRDPETNEEYLPHVIEPTWGVDRTLLVVLLSAYTEEGEGNDKRVVLKLKPALAPYKAAVFPLLKNKPELVAKARQVYDTLRKHFPVAWDDRGNIGKRYLAQDEIGTPVCITVDFETIEKDNMVTVRDRDTKEQKRVAIADLAALILQMQ